MGEEEDVGVDVQDHLRDSVDGSMRLKRLLLGEHDISAKRRRMDEIADGTDGYTTDLLQGWGIGPDMPNFAVCKFALKQLHHEDIDRLVARGWKPKLWDTYTELSEQIINQARRLQEEEGPGGGALDPIALFRFRWGLDGKADQFLRSLCHKDLRYVISSFDNSQPLEEVAAEAAQTPPELGTAAGTVPRAAGPLAIGRFQRLELIDPLADALICGDANLTFSLKLARHRKGLGHVGRVVATTFEQLETLKERYAEIQDTITELEEHYAEVWHGVDCTRLAVDHRFEGHEDSFGAVYYNFPHAGAVSGFFDAHPLVNWRHENLMLLFFRALRFFVKPGGSVKVSSNKGAMGVRYSYIIRAATDNEFVHVETLPFKEWHLHKYLRSYGDKRDKHKRVMTGGTGYNAQKEESDMVYCFCYAPTGADLPPQEIRLPPTKKDLEQAQEGRLKGPVNANRKKLVESLHERFLSEVQGVHVG
mmetsp:Transcript_132187/g.233826  ORF Transcript_132187/g.233826 Transcript_132187/m.233826 type:complete len:476 (-) Transcript_132187:67-1494(-)